MDNIVDSIFYSQTAGSLQLKPFQAIVITTSPKYVRKPTLEHVRHRRAADF